MTTMTLQPTGLPEFDRDKLNYMLDKTKGRLFFMPGASWRGTLLCSHKLIWDVEAPTAWCDGSTIAFNPWYFLNLGKDERVTLLAHELDHTMYDHAGRLGDRDPELWNIAADYVINNDLDRQGYSFKDMRPLLDHKYDGMSTEQVYELLLEEHEKKGKPKPSGSLSPLCGDLREPEQGAGAPGRHEIVSKIIQAVQAAHMAKEAGSLPGEIQGVIDSFLDPVLPWEKLLRRYFTEMSNDDYSWKRPNRRYEDIYLPTMIGDNGLDHLIYYLDVSGSITDEQALRFFSEVRSIHKDLQPKLLTLVMFDTKIQDEITFTPDDAFDKIEITGRGGTSLAPVYDHIVKHKPTAAIIFSDMYVHAMKEDPSVPLLWIVMDNPRAQVNFGKMIHLTAEQIG